METRLFTSVIPNPSISIFSSVADNCNSYFLDSLKTDSKFQIILSIECKMVELFATVIIQLIININNKLILIDLSITAYQ